MKFRFYIRCWLWIFNQIYNLYEANAILHNLILLFHCGKNLKTIIFTGVVCIYLVFSFPVNEHEKFSLTFFGICLIGTHAWESIMSTEQHLILSIQCTRGKNAHIFELHLFGYLFVACPLCSTYLPGVTGARSNLTENKNWMAHTNKQHKFKHKDSAHSASVTS